MYKSTRFTARTPEEIAADLPALRALWPRARTVFLADSDSLTHPRLPEIVSAVRRAFPEADRITSYARLHTLWRRTPEWLGRVRRAGVTRIHAGLESGAPRILEACRKGVTPEQAIEGSRNAIDAGFELSLYVLCGLGGEDDWEEHARESARVVAEVVPHFLRLRSLALLPGTPLHAAWAEGRFAPAGPRTRLLETRRLVAETAERLAAAGAPREVELTSDHLTNYVWADGELVYGGVNGYLPGDARLLLSAIDGALAAVDTAGRAEDVGALALRGRVPRL
jgi:coproporphyrinogen III oxidase-like Fe-S oxidoreductase